MNWYQELSMQLDVVIARLTWVADAANDLRGTNQGAAAQEGSRGLTTPASATVSTHKLHKEPL